jgi:acetyl esterase/lipase
MSKPVLEKEAQQIADATSRPPFLYELGPEGARKVLDDLQAAPIDKPDVDERWIEVPADVGDVRVRLVKPVDSTGELPVVLYIHGGGWVLGNPGGSRTTGRPRAWTPPAWQSPVTPSAAT